MMVEWEWERRGWTDAGSSLGRPTRTVDLRSHAVEVLVDHAGKEWDVRYIDGFVGHFTA